MERGKGRRVLLLPSLFIFLFFEKCILMISGKETRKIAENRKGWDGRTDIEKFPNHFITFILAMNHFLHHILLFFALLLLLLNVPYLDILLVLSKFFFF